MIKTRLNKKVNPKRTKKSKELSTDDLEQIGNLLHDLVGTKVRISQWNPELFEMYCILEERGTGWIGERKFYSEINNGKLKATVSFIPGYVMDITNNEILLSSES